MARKKKAPITAKAARRKRRKSKSTLHGRIKEFYYRGYTLEELQQMPTDEFMLLLPSRARRTLLRGYNEEQQKLIDKLQKSDEVVKTHRRDVVIMPSFIGKTISVYNGKEFIKFEMKPEMIGHRLGEFALTRKTDIKHSGPGVGATRGSKFMPLK